MVIISHLSIAKAPRTAGAEQGFLMLLGNVVKATLPPFEGKAGHTLFEKSGSALALMAEAHTAKMVHKNIFSPSYSEAMIFSPQAEVIILEIAGPEVSIKKPDFFQGCARKHQAKTADFFNPLPGALLLTSYPLIYSEELLNVWMTIVEYHEINYLPLKKTFNQLCEFVYETQDQTCFVSAPEIQAIKNHEFVQGRDWEYFFSE